jgi:hypothetical protein
MASLARQIKESISDEKKYPSRSGWRVVALGKPKEIIPGIGDPDYRKILMT